MLCDHTLSLAAKRIAKLGFLGLFFFGELNNIDEYGDVLKKIVVSVGKT